MWICERCGKVTKETTLFHAFKRVVLREGLYA